jgi:UDP-N-acetylglucosamine pyrophosphorylase
LYVVCNEDNFYAVKQVFLDNNHFGIPNTMVQFFVQPNLPILDDEGHIVLNARNTPELRPAGTGSALGTFLQSNFLTRT